MKATTKALALAAVLAMGAAPVFAQSAAGGGGGAGSGASGTGGAGSAGTTGVVTGTGAGGARTTATGVAPADGSSTLGQAGASGGMAGAPDRSNLYLGATIAPVGAPVTTTMGNTSTTVTRYWYNVPEDYASNHNFRRWQALK